MGAGRAINTLRWRTRSLKSVGPVGSLRPRLKRVMSWPRAKAASTRVRPTKCVPPSTRSFIASDVRE